MKLKKTKSGNWAKETTLSAGGKWRKCTDRNVPLEVAEKFAAVQIAKGRKTEIRAARPCADDQPGFQVWAYISRGRQVMQHASSAECLAAGVSPGRCNQ